MRKSLTKKQRFTILYRDKFTCRYCGRKSPDVELHIDHIVAVAKGGSNDISNLVTACVDCNSGKRDGDWFKPARPKPQAVEYPGDPWDINPPPPVERERAARVEITALTPRQEKKAFNDAHWYYWKAVKREFEREAIYDCYAGHLMANDFFEEAGAYAEK